MSTPLLQVQNASVKLAGVPVLDNIGFSLESGEILGIAGSNGSGKSTLLRLISSECEAESGSVALAGSNLAALPPRARAQLLAVLPQSAGLQFAFTVEQLVALGRAPHQDYPGAGQLCVEQAIEACDLSALRSRSYLSLSGGERQRAQLARVLSQLLAPDSANLTGKLLLLDEPTSALDIRHQEATRELLLTLRERGCSILLVMHDLNLLSRCADRLLFLREGRMLSVGPTDEQLDDATLLATFAYPLRRAPAVDDQPAFVYPVHAARTSAQAAAASKPVAGTDPGARQRPPEHGPETS